LLKVDTEKDSPDQHKEILPNALQEIQELPDLVAIPEWRLQNSQIARQAAGTPFTGSGIIA
jgi:hypothetical protein